VHDGADPRDELPLIDLAEAPPMLDGAAAATRRSPSGHDLAFTAVTRDHQPSAWARDAMYGGGLLLGALVLASAWLASGANTRRRRRPAAQTTAVIRERSRL
jgi:hypothetical protein